MENLIFYDEAHKEFWENIDSTRKSDPYHASLIYLLGLTEDTRQHFKEIYNIDNGEINIEILDKAWQTGTSRIIIRLAFNLFNGFTGISTEDSSKEAWESRINEAKRYAVDNIFYKREFADYFYQAIKIRFEI